MRVEKNAESFVGIIIGVFILSFVILGIANLIIYSSNLIESYTDTARVNILKESLWNIVKKLDTSTIQEGEVFYLYKNNTTSTYQIFTGSVNQWAKYVDENGESIANIVTYSGSIYGRFLWTEREDTTLTEQDQIIRASIRKLIKKQL